MPARASLPIALLAAHTAPPADDVEAVERAADLLVALVGVPDPRKTRGVRHRLVTVLAAAVCAVLAGARSYVTIAEWAHDLPVSVRVRLGIGRRAPSESTFRRILQSVDADALDRVVSGWLARRAAAVLAAAPVSAPLTATATSTAGSSAGSVPAPVRAIAVDGKTARVRHEVACNEWITSWRRPW